MDYFNFESANLQRLIEINPEDVHWFRPTIHYEESVAGASKIPKHLRSKATSLVTRREHVGAAEQNVALQAGAEQRPVPQYRLWEPSHFIVFAPE